MLTIYFLRHAESYANTEKFFCHRDCEYGITENGKLQTLEFIEETKKISFNKIVSSPLKRAIETAEILSSTLKINYSIEESLVEFDAGVLEGKCDRECWFIYHELLSNWLINLDWDKKIDGGESFWDMRKRFIPFIDKIKTIPKKNEYNILLVGHGGLFRCMIPILADNIDFRFSYENSLSNCQTIILKLQENAFHCIKWGNRAIED